MTTRFDRARDILDKAVMDCYEALHISNPELHAINAAIADVMMDLEAEAVEEIDRGEKPESYMKSVAIDEDE